MQPTENNKSYRPAWKDRIGLNDRWRRDLDLCSDTFGTAEYIDRVECLRNDLVNIKDGPQLVDIVKEYVKGDLEDYRNGVLDFWKKENPEFISGDDLVLKVKKEINLEASKMLHHFILQLLENNGFGMYQTTQVKRRSDGYLQYDNNEYDNLEYDNLE